MADDKEHEKNYKDMVSSEVAKIKADDTPIEYPSQEQQTLRDRFYNTNNTYYSFNMTKEHLKDATLERIAARDSGADRIEVPEYVKPYDWSN